MTTEYRKVVLWKSEKNGSQEVIRGTHETQTCILKSQQLI